MAAEDLNQPLRQRRVAVWRLPRLPVAAVLTAAFGVFAAVALVWVAVVDDPQGGRAVAVAVIEQPAPSDTDATAAPSVGRPKDGTLPAAAVAVARPPATVRATAQPLEELIEPTAAGPIPKIAADGLRPLDAYARPPRSDAAAGVPRVVIIVGGLGISQTGTQEAIRLLPEDVTLAFAPYGASLGRWAGRAREEGHEILLQLPLEPLGYPDVDPGEHTLLADADPEENRARLYWLLSRITSFAGVMNYLGGRFSGEEAALRPLLAELAGRGLLYVDDASSPDSLAGELGAAMRAPVVAADLVLDAERDAAAIGRRLDALERTARGRGLAVGVASAFPVSVQTIAAWVAGAEGRGLVVVPASAALDR